MLFTCTGSAIAPVGDVTDLGSNLVKCPCELALPPSFPSSMLQVLNVTTSSGVRNSIDVISTLFAADVSQLNGSLLQCRDSFGVARNTQTS